MPLHGCKVNIVSRVKYIEALQMRCNALQVIRERGSACKDGDIVFIQAQGVTATISVRETSGWWRHVQEGGCRSEDA